MHVIPKDDNLEPCRSRRGLPEPNRTVTRLLHPPRYPGESLKWKKGRIGECRGEFVGIMGASGSGKTTLLQMIAAIDSPSAGRIILDDRGALKGVIFRQVVLSFALPVILPFSLGIGNQKRRIRTVSKRPYPPF